MRSFIVPICVLVVLSGWGLWLSAQETSAPAEVVSEKTVTITERQLEDIVSRRIAQTMINEDKSLDDLIMEARNWHVAVFDGVIYHIYTGPGQIQARSWYQKVETPTVSKATPPAEISKTKPLTITVPPPVSVPPLEK